MSQDDIPELDDFQPELKSIHAAKISSSSQDYTKVNTRHIQNEAQLQKQISKIKIEQKNIQSQIQKNKKPQQYAGFKKGFLSSGNQVQKKQKIPQLKGTKKNGLQIKQVQQAMKMNNYLEETRKQWMTENFLDNVTSNNKINKLFSNPQYMKAIDMFKTNPKEAMAKYGNNKQFMQGFQQFCKMMGSQFQNLAKTNKK